MHFLILHHHSYYHPLKCSDFPIWSPPTPGIVILEAGDDDAAREMKLELYNFLPEPGCALATQARTLGPPGPGARPTFTTTIRPLPLSPLTLTLPCRPPRGGCPDPMQCSLQCCRLSVHVYTHEQNRIGPSKAVMMEHWSIGDQQVLFCWRELHCFTSPWLRLGWGEWSQAALPPPAAGALNCGQAGNFATISRECNLKRF